MFENNDLTNFTDDVFDIEDDESGCGSGGCASCAGCGGGGDGSGEAFVFKTAPTAVKIEFVYIEGLDDDKNNSKELILNNIINDINPVLKMTGIALEYLKTPVNNLNQVNQYKLMDSSSVYVNGTAANESMVDEISQNTLANNILEIIFSTAPSIQDQPGIHLDRAYEIPHKITEYFNAGKKTI